MNTERTTALGNVDDSGDEFRNGALEECELVEDDQQVGGSLVGVDLLQLDDVLRAELGKYVLALLQFRIERGKRTKSKVGVEVGEETHRVRKFDTILERRSTLVINEHEIESLRGVSGSERCDDALEQLALTRSGRTSDQPMGAMHSKIQVVDTGGRQPNVGAELLRSSIGVPPTGDLCWFATDEIEQIEEQHRFWNLPRCGSLGDISQRCNQSRRIFCLGTRQALERDSLRTLSGLRIEQSASRQIRDLSNLTDHSITRLGSHDGRHTKSVTVHQDLRHRGIGYGTAVGNHDEQSRQDVGGRFHTDFRLQPTRTLVHDRLDS